MPALRGARGGMAASLPSPVAFVRGSCDPWRMAPGSARKAVGAVVYPAAMAGAVFALSACLEAGVDSGLAVVVVNVIAAAVVLGLERALPYRPAWNRSAGDLRTDALHAVVNGVAGEIGRILTVAGLTWVSVRLSSAIGARLWPSSWPLALQLALALPISEFGVYWLHRLEHAGGFLWRLHAVHHSAPRLYFLNSARNHPLDAVLSLALLVAPLALLGAGERLLSTAMVIWATHALFQHSNVDVRLGPLNILLSMAEVHRWHHSRSLNEANANYGQTLLVWDIVFGTRNVPVDRDPPEDVGIADMPAYPQSWWRQVTSPMNGPLWAHDSAPPGEAPKTGFPLPKDQEQSSNSL